MTTEFDTAIAVSSIVSVLIVAGFYAWYGFALSRLFPRLGAAGWKGWVPILNEVEILERGGVPGWSVVYYVLPVVQLYGLYLKALAVHRINESFGKGAGFTVLGLFLPPVWASLLAASRMPAPGDYDRRVSGLLTAEVITDPRPAPAAGPGYATRPPASPAAPVAVSFPSLTTSTEPAWPAFVAETLAAAPRAPRPPSTPTRPLPPPVLPPAVLDPVIVAPPEPARTEPARPEPAHPEPEDDDELDSTIVIDRRPAIPWRLVTDDGHVIPLRTRTVILGRKPTAAAAGTAVVTVPDTTKTLSKNHARLELGDDDTWTVVDLDSTNGVIIIAPDGSETLLPPGGSAPVPGRFMLGKVAMRVAFDDLEETR